MFVKRLFDVSHANLLSNNEKYHLSCLSDLKQKRSHTLRNDSLNEMANATHVGNPGNPRGSVNSALVSNDPILQNAIVRQVAQQNGNPNNDSDQFNNDLTNDPESSVQFLNNANPVTPQVPCNIAGNNFVTPQVSGNISGDDFLGCNSEENNIFLQAPWLWQ